MIRLYVQGRFFRVQFRHTRNLSPELGVQAITTCVIMALIEPGYAEQGRIAFTAIGNTLCWNADQFSRRRGRLNAFANALDTCHPLIPLGLELFRAYFAVDPDPPPPRPRVKLDERIKRARWEAGWEKRQQRALEKAKGHARTGLGLAIAGEQAEREGAR
ncbi:MAG: hypothetical protein V4502_08210 [Pseudomonadota bacterium]